MIINPIIPIWLMAIICVIFLILKKKGTFNYIRQILIIALLFVINLRIMLPGDEVETVAPNIDILFVIDNTISILAEDYDGKGRRIDAVKSDCAYIMDKFEGASFSVVVYDNNIDKKTPYTTDLTMINNVIKALNGQPQYYATGTSLNKVMESMEKILDDERENCKLLFFITDGEVVNSEELKSYEGLDKYIFDGAVLGYGTEEGGPMKVVDFYGDEEKPSYLYYYDEDYNRKKAISCIDEKNLKQIAADFGIDYIHMTKQSEIDAKIDELLESTKNFATDDETEETTGNKDIYYFFVIPLLVLMIIDYVYYRKRT